jgi:DNA-binding transcriptional LysR family regulator
VESLLVAREPVVAAVHPTHPLADRGQIPLRALQQEPMVTLTRASKLRTTLETACHAGLRAPDRRRNQRP